MAVYDSTDIDSRDLLSQTPPNFVEDNYWNNFLQMKVDTEWELRPNRKWIEMETEPGSNSFNPLEVVIQTVKNDKGTPVSDDCYRVVFRDCSRMNTIGQRYRFSFSSDPHISDDKKNIWIGLNNTTLKPTSSQVIYRCNSSIGSIYINNEGKQSIHFEPVYVPDRISGTELDKDFAIYDAAGRMTMICQHNQYTKQYYINERFVIGTDKIYKITNIDRGITTLTYDPDALGIIKIYLEMDQASELDDFETRIAHNGEEEKPIPEETKEGKTLKIISPNNIPKSFKEITLEPKVYDDDGQEVHQACSFSCELVGIYAAQADVNDYVSQVDNGDGTWTFTRLDEDLSLMLKITCTSGTGDKELRLEIMFELFG